MNEPYFEDVKAKKDQPYYPFRCFIQDNDGSPVMAPAHWHDRIEILYGTRGSATVFLNGQYHQLKKGDMVLVSTREVHAAWGEPDTQYAVINFDPEILYTAAHSIIESRYILPFTMARESPQKIFPKAEIDSTPLPNMILSAVQERQDRKYGYELAVRTLISQIFLWILRTWHARGLEIKTGNSLREEDLKRMQAIFEEIDKQYMQNLTAEVMAQRFNMSYSYFSRHFKSATGMSFTAYLNFIRLAEAEKLLIATGKTITEIAMETGFSSASYFISQFRTHRSVSPRQFRLKMNNLQ
jgi:AraC-like DNA-binding protein